MLFYLVLAVLAASAQCIMADGGSPGECSYTSDCALVEKCQNVQDTSCVCKFGECVYDGNQFFKNSGSCTDYTECNCSETPETCFCREGTCVNEAWECHKENDCWGMAKCQEVDCRCSSYNTCEPYDCYEVSDCINGAHDCNNYNGFTCNCTQNVCETVHSEAATVDAFHSDPITDVASSSCSFSAECESLDYCTNAQDASCVCKGGKCILDDIPVSRGQECSNHTECACSDTPDNCFCRNGHCKEETWECHGYEDCDKLEKCQSVTCMCSPNDLCEPYYECTSTEDCLNGGYNCVDSYEGYTCSCENFVCNLKAIEYANYGQSEYQSTDYEYFSSGDGPSVNYDYNNAGALPAQ
jgi:hypothetical protein